MDAAPSSCQGVNAADLHIPVRMQAPKPSSLRKRIGLLVPKLGHEHKAVADVVVDVASSNPHFPLGRILR